MKALALNAGHEKHLIWPIVNFSKNSQVLRVKKILFIESVWMNFTEKIERGFLEYHKGSRLVLFVSDDKLVINGARFRFSMKLFCNVYFLEWHQWKDMLSKHAIFRRSKQSTLPHLRNSRYVFWDFCFFSKFNRS